MIDILSPISICPPFDLSGVVPGPALPAPFAHAVRARLEGDAMLMGALEGGLWWREAPARRPGRGWPFGVFLIPADRFSDVSTRGDYLREGILQVSIFGPSQDIARRIADRAAGILVDADARGLLAFAGGRLLYLRPSNPASSSRPERGPGGAITWQEVRQLSLIYQGNYSMGV